MMKTAKSKIYDSATPYIASYIILRRGKKVAFVLRSQTGWMDGYYGLIAGKVEKNETFEQAAVREAKEEAGITVKPTDLKHVLTGHRKDKKSDYMFWVDVLFEVTKWSGQAYNAEPKMHDELRWFDTNHLPKNLIPAIQSYLQAVAEGRSYIEYGWDK